MNSRRVHHLNRQDTLEAINGVRYSIFREIPIRYREEYVILDCALPKIASE